MSNENNHYEAPESNLVTPTTGEWGSVERGVIGDYQLSIGQVFSDAWELTKGVKGTFWLAFIVYLLIVMAVGFSLGFVFGVLGMGAQAAVLQSVVMQVAVTLVSYPLMAGIMLIGVYRSVGEPISIHLLFNNWSKTVPLFVCYLIMMVLITIGFLLFVLPGIYLTFAYMLAMPLIVEKGLGPWEALEASRKAISKRWFSVFFIFIILMFVMSISAIPLGIGLIWTVPLSVMVMSVMYRNIFGVNSSPA